MTYDTIRPAVGASLENGRAYHDIPGVDGPTHRTGSQARADQIAAAIDVNGKSGVDLGCSVGGVSFGLVAHGASMFGFDHDDTAIEVANAHAATYDLDAFFTTVDLADRDGWAQVFEYRYDFAVWLANWMWVARAAGEQVARTRLLDLSMRVPVLVFETAQAGGSMAGTFGMTTDDDVLRLLRESTVYTDIRRVGPVVDGWHSRSLFVASGGHRAPPTP